jgi:hypothetical protein
MDGACSACGADEKCIHNFGCRARREEGKNIMPTVTKNFRYCRSNVFGTIIQIRQVSINKGKDTHFFYWAIPPR